MLPKVRELEHYKKETLKAEKDPEYEIQPYIKPVVKRKRGRPKNVDRPKVPIGRPKGTEGRIAELRERLLTTSGEKVIDKVIKIALEDGHKDQIAALKMCLDRVLPISMFDKASKNGNQIQINIVNATDETNTVDISVEDVSDLSDSKDYIDDDDTET